MSTCPRHYTRKIALLLMIIFSATFATTSSGANTYTIKHISAVKPGHNPILIGRSCTYDVAQIKVEVVSAQDVSVAEAHVSAYLYDADKKLINTYDRPPTSPCTVPQGVKPKPLPIMFDARKPRMIYFPTEGPDDTSWKSIVVIFGDDDTVAAKVYPSGNPQDFDFPERALLK